VDLSYFFILNVVLSVVTPPFFSPLGETQAPLGPMKTFFRTKIASRPFDAFFGDRLSPVDRLGALDEPQSAPFLRKALIHNETFRLEVS